MTSRFILPFADVGSGLNPAVGAKLFFFETDGATPKDTFTTKAASIANANPVIALDNGVFPAIYIQGDYLVTLKNKNDVQKFGLAPVSEFSTVTDGVFSKNFDTLSLAVADASLVDGDLLRLKGRNSVDDQGQAFWNVVLLSSVTPSIGEPSIGNIVVSDGVPTLALVLQEDDGIQVARWGAVDGVSSTTAIQLAFDAAGNNGSVTYPKGNWIQGKIQVPWYCSIFGQSMGETTITSTATDYAFELGFDWTPISPADADYAGAVYQDFNLEKDLKKGRKFVL